MARSINITSGDTIGIPSGAGSSIDDIANATPRAWLQYNQTTPAIEDSYNVDSVTDASAGIYQVNFTTNFTTTTYSVVGIGSQSAGNAGVNPYKYNNVQQAAGDIYIITLQGAGISGADTRTYLAFLGDQ